MFARLVRILVFGLIEIDVQVPFVVSEVREVQAYGMSGFRNDICVSTMSINIKPKESILFILRKCVREYSEVQYFLGLHEVLSYKRPIRGIPTQSKLYGIKNALTKSPGHSMY